MRILISFVCGVETVEEIVIVKWTMSQGRQVGWWRKEIDSRGVREGRKQVRQTRGRKNGREAG